MNRTFLWLRIVAALFLTVALLDLQSFAYSLLRVVTALAAVEGAWLAYRREQRAWLLPFAAIAILWNPIWEVEFPKATWQILDIVAAIVFVLSIRHVSETTLLSPRVKELGGRGVSSITSASLPPSRYIWMTLSIYGLLPVVFFGFPSLMDFADQFGLSDLVRYLFIAALVLLVVAVLASKIIYIRHVMKNPNVKFKVVWSLVILVLHFWSELIYYFTYLRGSDERPTGDLPSGWRIS